MSFDEGRERVRAASPILDIVGEYGVDAKQKGGVFWAICPFHDEKTPSFKVDPERGTFHCFGSCAEGGDVFSFVQKIADTDFPGALRLLAERGGIELAPNSYSSADREAGRRRQEMDLELLEKSKKWYEAQFWGPRGAQAREYLRGRGFTDETMRRFGIGYAPEEWNALGEAIANSTGDVDRALSIGLLQISRDGSRHHDYFRDRVMFPIRGIRKRVVGFGGRNLHGKDTAKYVNSRESSVFNKGQLLYGLEESRKSIRLSREVMLMEGYTDVMMAAQVIAGLPEEEQQGIPSPIATMGTALTEENVAQVTRRADRVWLIFDGDEAGKKAAIRASQLFLKFPRTDAYVVLLSGGDDPCDLFSRDGGLVDFRRHLEVAPEPLVFLLDEMIGERQALTAAAKNKLTEDFFRLLLGVESPITRRHGLELLAGKRGVSLEVIETEFTRVKKPVRTAREEPETLEKVSISDEEETLLVHLQAFPEQRELLGRLTPPENLDSPRARSLAMRILSAEGSLEPLAVEDRIEKSILIGLQDRVTALEGSEYPLEFTTDLLIRWLASHEKESLADGGRDDDSIRHSLEIKRTTIEINQERGDLTIPDIEKILDRFQEPAALREE